MFKLDNAIQQWCELVLSAECVQSKSLDELKDHLHCEIEKLIGRGMTEQDAFETAISSIGEVSALADEYKKNQKFLGKLCAFEFGTIGEHAKLREEGMLNAKKVYIKQAILWASAMLGASIILVDSGHAMPVLFLVLLPLSVANMLMLRRKKDASTFACFRRKFVELIKR